MMDQEFDGKGLTPYDPGHNSSFLLAGIQFFFFSYFLPLPQILKILYTIPPSSLKLNTFLTVSLFLSLIFPSSYFLFSFSFYFFSPSPSFPLFSVLFIFLFFYFLLFHSILNFLLFFLFYFLFYNSIFYLFIKFCFLSFPLGLENNYNQLSSI